MAIVELTGLSYPAVRLAIDLYERGGVAALKPAPRGRTLGGGRRLNAEQEDAIRRTICNKRPEQMKMDFALWTRGAVLPFIEQAYNAKLSIRAVGGTRKKIVDDVHGDQPGQGELDDHRRRF